MMNFTKIAAGTAIAASLGLAALGIGTGVANAAPSSVGSGIQWAQDHGGPGWNGGGGGWNGGGRDGGDRDGGYGGYGGGWAPPPPDYGYGGYGGGYDNGGGGCFSGPLGLLHFCP